MEDHPPKRSRRDVLTNASILPLPLLASNASPTQRAATPASFMPLSVRAFGASGDGRADDIEPIERALRAAIDGQHELCFPGGVYRISRPLRLGFSGLRVRGEGQAVLRFSGNADHCVSIDAGEQSILYNNVIENLTIEGSGAEGQDGLLIRNAAHGIRRNIRVRNVRRFGFNICGDVLSLYENCIVSDNELDFAQTPETAFFIGHSRSISSTTACTFLNCLAEIGRRSGWHLENASHNKWIGGTSEGIAGHGLVLSANSAGNSFDSFFMEENAEGDLLCLGRNTVFRECAMTSRSSRAPYDEVKSIQLKAESSGIRIVGGLAYAAQIDKGAAAASFEHVNFLYRIFDAGEGTRILSCRQLYNSSTHFPSQTLGNIDDPNPDALDWYRETAFKPRAMGEAEAGGFGYSVQTGLATRIGNTCFFSIELRVASIQQALRGPLLIVGLPFHASKQAPCTMVSAQLSISTIGGTQLFGHIRPGENLIRLETVDGKPFESRSINASSRLCLSGHYFM